MVSSRNRSAWLPWPLVLCLLQDIEGRSETCSGDAGCGVVGSSMLQSSYDGTRRAGTYLEQNLAGNSTGAQNTHTLALQAPVGEAQNMIRKLIERKGKGALSELSQPRGEPDDSAVDEPDRAPSYFVNKLLFLAFAGIVLIVMMLFLAVIEFIVRQVNNAQVRHLAKLDAAKAEEATAPAATGAAEEAEDGEKGKLPSPRARRKNRKQTLQDVSNGINGHALWKRMNGDHARLGRLLTLAGSEQPEAKVKELIEKVAKAFKLTLSSLAIEQACEGLLALTMAVSEVQRKHLGDFNAKEKLQRAIKEVVTMVRVSKAFGMKIDTHKEDDEWTHTHGEAHAEHVEKKYADGDAGVAHGRFRDTRLGKSKLGAYFASQRWLDHTAILFVFLYSQLCALVYALYLRYRFPRMYDFMGPWLLVSRGEAMAIIVQTMMMIFFLSRGAITRVRPYMAWSTVLQTVADKHVLIHKYLGVMLVVCAALHILGHLKGSIPAIIGETDTKKINAAFTYGTKIRFNFNTWGEALVCWPAVTGYILVLILICFWAASNEWVRRRNFELFHYPHLVLIVLWCAALIAHGWKQWLGLGVPVASISVLPAVVYYAFERIKHIREARHPSIRISNAIVQKTNVNLEIDVGSTGFAFETGMYCMLRIPAISQYQWHPFTIASAGGTNKFHVLFAVVGNWTTALKDLLVDAQKSKGPYPEIHVRGGYGAPAQGMKDHTHIIMVGGGVGATPFLSFLSTICNSAKGAGTDQFKGIQTAVFYWLSRDPVDFAWVNEYDTIIKATDSLKDRVSLKLFLTKSLDVSKEKQDCDAAEVALFWLGLEIATSKFDSPELAAELGVPTNFGRPEWVKEFTAHAKALRASSGSSVVDVAVFVCGNKMIVESLEKACTEVTDKTTTFRVYAEEF